MPIEITMPALSPTMTEGNLSKWLKKEGDKVESGDVIAEIETDKATMEVEAVDEGVLGQILIKSGTQNVKVNEVIGLILAEGEDKNALKDYKPRKQESLTDEYKSNSEQQEVKEETKIVESQQSAQPAVGLMPKPELNFAVGTLSSSSNTKPYVKNDGNAKASPLAKRLAKEAGVNLSNIVGTGPHGRIVKSDIEEVIRLGGSKKIYRNANEYNQIANNNMRKVIAQRLLASKQHVPHFYLNIDCQIDKLLDLRKDLNDEAELTEDGKPAYKVSVNDLIIKACAFALKKVPLANASWTDEAIVTYNNIDISVAVAVDGGLVTPIVRNADQKDLPTISNEMKDLALRARQGKLAPEEYQGGGFSISNLGMFGIKQFNAIINPPQSCILAVGAGFEKPIVKNGKIEVANIVSLTLSSDHRVVDGVVGAEFLAALKGYIEKPVTMFL